MNTTTLPLPFKRGDIVRLVSGGPPMTVYEIHRTDDPDGPFVKCRWFTPDNMLQWATFAVATIAANVSTAAPVKDTIIRPVKLQDDQEAMPR